MAVATLIFGTLLLVVIVNAMVYALYKFHLNSMVWFLLTQGAAMETLSFSSQTWFAAIAIAVFVYAAQLGVAVGNRALRVSQRCPFATTRLRCCASASSRSSSTRMQTPPRKSRCSWLCARSPGRNRSPQNRSSRGSDLSRRPASRPISHNAHPAYSTIRSRRCNAPAHRSRTS